MRGKILLLLCVCVVACHPTPIKNHLVLSVDLDKRESVSMFTLFDKIELIPLETTKNSLIRAIDKIAVYESKYYVFDQTQSIIFVFDSIGKYERQIGRIGRGPGEYTHATDFHINNKGQVEILTPFKLSYTYDLSGLFLYKTNFNGENVLNLQRFEYLNDQMVFYSIADHLNNQINLFSKEGKFIRGFDSDWSMVNFFSQQVFYAYDKNVYFCKSLYNEIYSVQLSGLEIAYEWDFGKKTIDRNKYSSIHTDDNQQYKTIINLMETSEIPYFFNQQNQSSLYYYAQIVMNLKNTFNLFYHKQTQVYYLFEQTSEQVVMNPKYWQDDYIIGTSNDNFYTKDKVLNRELLNDKNYQILLSIKEEDNPCLVKYHFKK